MEIRKWDVYLADLNPRFGTEPVISIPGPYSELSAKYFRSPFQFAFQQSLHHLHILHGTSAILPGLVDEVIASKAKALPGGLQDGSDVIGPALEN